MTIDYAFRSFSCVSREMVVGSSRVCPFVRERSGKSRLYFTVQKANFRALGVKVQAKEGPRAVLVKTLEAPSHVRPIPDVSGQ